jgi:hypothetical protein
MERRRGALKVEIDRLFVVCVHVYVYNHVHVDPKDTNVLLD